jgi:dipeptidyl aminopeptidase/acylaminoacyl peptidase
MSSPSKSKLTGALIAAIALFAFPSSAGATLVYVKNPMKPAVYAASDNGGGAFKVGPGTNPRVSPDGNAIAYAHGDSSGNPVLKLAAAAGGGARTVMTGLQDSFHLAFSPDSKLIAALRGPVLGKRKLVLIDVTSGTFLRTLATGYFGGFSFSPDGTELVYSQSASEDFASNTDVYRVPVAGGEAVRLTTDHASLEPLWGPNDRIVFVKLLGAKQRKYGPKNELFLMNPSGSQVKRLTNTKVGALLQGLTPTAWSDDGAHLLAEFVGQDTSYAVTVNPQSDAQHRIGPRGEQGFVGTALSGDGSTVLGFTGGFEPGPNHRVATVPYAGGKLATLVKNAFEPDWSR